MSIEQALCQPRPRGEILARSPGFVEEWTSEIVKICEEFGSLPAGVTCPLGLFARPLGWRQMAIVRVTDRAGDSLLFHVLILPARYYLELSADPFLLAETFPIDWGSRGELPSLSWTAPLPARRSVEQIRRVLDVVADRTQTLLGGVQILMDGGRIVFVRDGPDPSIVRDLWMLLPTETRSEIWPATLYCGKPQPFQLIVAPNDHGEEFNYYVREADAGDYPEGRYELALQQATEDGDQAALDSLFARRSRGHVLRLATALLLVFLLIPVFVFLSPGCPGIVDAPRREKPNE